MMDFDDLRRALLDYQDKRKEFEKQKMYINGSCMAMEKLLELLSYADKAAFGYYEYIDGAADYAQEEARKAFFRQRELKEQTKKELIDELLKDPDFLIQLKSKNGTEYRKIIKDLWDGYSAEQQQDKKFDGIRERLIFFRIIGDKKENKDD